jgi:virginiamycin B lyase
MTGQRSLGMIGGRGATRRSLALVALALAAFALSPGVAQAFVFWANEGGNTIGRDTIDGNAANINQSFISGANQVKGVAIDGAHIYWSNFQGNSIGRANIDGSQPNANFITGANLPEGVAVDGSFIYWVNQGSGTIGRDSIDGNPANVNQGFITGLNIGVGVAVDSNFIYWTNFGAGTIGQAHLDGTSPNQSFIPSGQPFSPSGPSGIAVNSNFLYWTNYNSTTIGRDTTDGNTANINESFIDSGLGTPVAIALDSNFVYWTNRFNGTIGRDTIDGNAANIKPAFITGTLSDVWGIAVADPPASVTPPTISGSALQGQTLTESHGSWSNSPSRFSIQWLRCNSAGASCSAISGATSGTYQLALGDVGSTIRGQEVATNNNGGDSSAVNSAQSAVVRGLPPLNISPPTISGTSVNGQTLTEVHGSWTNNPTGFGFQWERCDVAGNNCTAIVGASGQTYVVGAADVGLTIRVEEAASNPFGTSSPVTSDPTAVAPAPHISLAKVSATGATASLTVNCVGAGGETCAGSITATSLVTTQGSKTIAVKASAKKKTTVISVASGSFSIASGKTAIVKIKLNKAGRRLLTLRYTVPATMRIGPTTTKVTFIYKRIKSPVSFTWSFTASSTVAQLLTVSGIPKGGSLNVFCSGGGCPFGKRKFKNKSKVALAPVLHGSHLRPGATVQLNITATNDVGKVLIFKIHSGASPSLLERCLPPGAHSPSRCA